MNDSAQPIEIKVYTSKVLLNWETPENKDKIEFPKKNMACRNCQFADWQILETENLSDEGDDFKQETTIKLEVENYCHDRYTKTFAKGMPNIPDCDGLYKAPKE